ncbi:hypothetical protein HZY91_05020 [Facklamia sp. DSM 111018]|uniref:Uncharacterized protein n=1 Tax=Facklamia lactis TaxID=2749967 RepID=A0ABS0LQ24_9LACT|nr:hypothetical protein [Facklamia lactis]MBG9986253.1 hypothetical protein [Facklamia lactis]
MSQMKQLQAINDKIKSFYEDWEHFYQAFVSEDPNQMTLDEYAIPDEQETVQPISFEAIQKQLAKKAQEGFSDEIRSLIKKMGSNKLSDLDPSTYYILWHEAEALSHDE